MNSTEWLIVGFLIIIMVVVIHFFLDHIWTELSSLKKDYESFQYFEEKRWDDIYKNIHQIKRDKPRVKTQVKNRTKKVKK